jgi:hypothetical protein
MIQPNARKYLLAIGVILLLLPDHGAFAQTWSEPTIGQFCPPGFSYDSANCFLSKAPVNSQPGVTANRFLYNASSCSLTGFTFDPGAGKCYRQVPAGYTPFVNSGGFYVAWNGHFVQQLQPICPAGSQYDSANCFFSKAPTGKVASILTNQFFFNKANNENCATLRPGSVPVGMFRCKVGNVPTGYTPFVYQNGWYVQPKQVFKGTWLVRDFIPDTAPNVRQACQLQGAQKHWQLIWSDEFETQADNQACYTSNDHLRCIQRPGWGIGPQCANSPTNWTAAALSGGWTAAQKTQFEGLQQLNKCTWAVYDSVNAWEVWGKTPPPMAERTNSLKPENIRIDNGTLKMRTNQHPTLHPGDGYNCGQQIEPDPAQNGFLWTKDCPYSGALIASETGLPWTKGNSASNPDPDQRYTGHDVSYGRIEFRARINKLGHGAWPALWMFVDQNPDKSPAEEMDVLEFLADQVPPTSNASAAQGITEQVKIQSSSYGMAWQTAHHYDSKGIVSLAVGIPIGTGEWHTYAVEYEPTEIRYYIDDCLTNRIIDGQQITNRFTNYTGIFRIPKNQTFNILIGGPASAAPYLPSWYRAYQLQTDLCGNADPKCANAEPFESTEFEVDYVRVYTDPNLPQLKRADATDNSHTQSDLFRTKTPGRFGPVPQQR